jgi:hypothetical protein
LVRDRNHRQKPGDLNGLLCPATLKVAIKRSSPVVGSLAANNKEVATRPQQSVEGEMGDLFSNLGKPDSVAAAPTLPQEAETILGRLEHGLDTLVAEFLTRRLELLRLNKARRDQIEAFLRSSSGTAIALEQVVHSRPGSNEHQALLHFAQQACVFQLLQVLLVKRWVDRGLIAQEPVKAGTGHALNWQITSFLRRNAPKGVIGRHDWSFTKQNIFSWYTPSRETLDNLQRLLAPVNLSRESSDFPARLLRSLGSRKTVPLIGAPPLIDARALWRLLLEQRAFDLRLNSSSRLDFSPETSGAVLVSGLGQGECLNSLRELTFQRELNGVWAFTDSEFERFLAEIFLLWDCVAEVPRINVHPRSVLRELARERSNSLFQLGQSVPYQAQFAACFQDEQGNELDDAISLLEPLRENGLLLIASDHFWPTDSSERCERLRECALKQSAIRLIVDLRQLSSSEGESLPKGITILEKSSSKELRDSNRPQILRARGKIRSDQLPIFWNTLLEQIKHESTPGEVNVRTLNSLGDGVRLEAMAAAASQQQLRSSPWISLSDPTFYDASGRLRRSPSKAYSAGTIFRWKPGMETPPARGLFLQETDKHLRAALPSQDSKLDADAPRYLFLPESSMPEDPSFFMAQIFSAPVQFWYRLELEQGAGKRGGTGKQSEQRLKLMPLVRLFEPGMLVPVTKSSRPFGSVDDLRKELAHLFSQPSLGVQERLRLHDLVLGLESSINQNIEVCADFTRHLYPSLPVCRWELPSQLPEIAPAIVLGIFGHLDRSPLLHHPAIHVTKLRNILDFKVTNCLLEEMPMGGMSELKIFHGVDAVLKMSGPSLLIRAAYSEIQKRIGRPWREISDRILFPTDYQLVQNQLREVVRDIETQLAATRDQIALMDQVFCCLFNLTTSFVDESARLDIRRHLSPEESRVQVNFAKDIPLIKPVRTEVPRGILQ